MKFLDVDGLAHLIDKIKSMVKGYVTAEDPLEIVDTIPPTFDGHLSTEFVYKNEVVNALVEGSTDPVSSGVVSTVIHELDAAKLDKAGGTMSGKLVAQSNSDYTIAQVRNIIVSTSEPTASDGTDGDIWIMYG